MSKQLVIIAHNIRSTHNVGSLLRTADGLGVDHIYLTGYTPYPLVAHDERLPHISQKLTDQIHKTALGAEMSVPWSHYETAEEAIDLLRIDNYSVAGLEQTPESISLPTFHAPDRLAIVLGSEVSGIDLSLLQLVDYTLEIPMTGTKESFNVVEAATMALYHCTYGIV